MDFMKKISINRPFSKPSRKLTDKTVYLDIAIDQLESDRGRLINSAAVRRLQQKTQVFPLEKNSAVRSRLTHSLEVQQTGRFIVKTIFKKLSIEEQQQYGLCELERHIETIVEMACLMHDIGNPAFGHFGEYAINQWFSKNIEDIFIDRNREGQLASELMHELTQFEGNAQAIRLVSNVISLNLTYVQMASLIKYIKPAFSKESYDHHKLNNLYKKAGYFWSEKDIIEKLNAELDLGGVRHPFVYIMEAADDISYCLADIEDAVEKNILTIDELKKILIQYVNSNETMKVFQGSSKSKSVEEILNYIIDHPYDHMDDISSFFVQFRAIFIHVLVEYAATQFIKNIENIYDGCLNKGLMDMGGIETSFTKALKKIAIKYVFNNHEVRTLELKGYQIIKGLLDYYSVILKASHDDFFNIVESIVDDSKDIKILTKNKVLVHLVNRLAKKHIKSYYKIVMSLEEDADFKVKELYYRCRLIQDYISGMTDQFAFDEYQELSVSGI